MAVSPRSRSPRTRQAGSDAEPRKATSSVRAPDAAPPPKSATRAKPAPARGPEQAAAAAATDRAAAAPPVGASPAAEATAAANPFASPFQAFAQAMPGAEAFKTGAWPDWRQWARGTGLDTTDLFKFPPSTAGQAGPEVLTQWMNLLKPAGLPTLPTAPGLSTMTEAVEAILDTYRAQRQAGENFITALKRIGHDPFKAAANAVRVATARTPAPALDAA